MADDQLFYVGQKAIVRKNNQILVLHDPILGFDFPGGKVQEGETDFAAALKREVFEETALQIEVCRPFAVGHFQYPVDGGHRNAGKLIYLVHFICSYVAGDVTLSDEHDSYLWVDQTNYSSQVTKEWERSILDSYFAL